jgi:hypothetical protein
MPKQVEAYDDSRVRYAFDKAPEVFAREIDHWLNIERVGFLGKTAKDTESTRGIRGRLYHKQTKFGGVGWPRSMVGQLKSYKENKGSIAAQIVMGLTGSNEEKNKAMELFESGGLLSAGKYMRIPNIEALRYFGVYQQSQAEQFFKDHLKGFQMVQSRRNPGNIVYLASMSSVDQRHREKFGAPTADMMPVFTLSKKAKIHKQFDFINTWRKRAEKALSRGEQAIYRATRKVEKMIREGAVQGGF